jgi:lipopolysaccharide exporter
VTSALPARTGSAVRWRSVQLIGVNALYFLRLVILAKLLAPEAFGTIAVANVAIGVVMKLSNIGIIPALTYRGAANDAERDAAWTAALLRASCVTVILVIAGPWVASWFRVPEAGPIIQVLVLRTMLDGAISIGLVQLTRDLQFRRIALMYLAAALVDLIVAVSLAELAGVWALVWGALAGAACTLIASYVVAPHRPKLNFDIGSIATLARYGRWVLLTGIVALVGSSLTQLGISRSMGPATLGIYFLATKIAFLVSEAVAQVAASVAFPMFSSMRGDHERIAEAFRTLLSGQLLLVLPIYALLIVLAPAVESALGDQWTGIATLLRILALASIVGAFGDILSPMLMGTGRPQLVLALEVVQTGVLLILLLPLISHFGVVGAALAWFLGNAAAFGLSLMLFRREMPAHKAWAPRRVSAALLASAIASALSAVVVLQLGDGLTGLIAAAAAGLILAVATLAVLDRVMDLRLREFVWIVRAGGNS